MSAKNICLGFIFLYEVNWDNHTITLTCYQYNSNSKVVLSLLHSTWETHNTILHPGMGKWNGGIMRICEIMSSGLQSINFWCYHFNRLEKIRKFGRRMVNVSFLLEKFWCKKDVCSGRDVMHNKNRCGLDITVDE